MSRRRRTLRPEERELWDKVAGTADRMPEAKRGLARIGGDKGAGKGGGKAKGTAGAPAPADWRDDGGNATGGQTDFEAEFEAEFGSRPDGGRGAETSMPSLTPFRVGEKAGARKGRGASSHDLVDPVHERLNRAPVRMDKKTHGKMTRGKMAPEARIDLHGMNVERAHRALTGFLLRAVQNDLRLVLVITGKGRRDDEGGPIPARHGVLRHQLPHWLSTPPLAQIVLQVSSAHQKHGGLGAYYIYLRRNR